MKVPAILNAFVDTWRHVEEGDQVRSCALGEELAQHISRGPTKVRNRVRTSPDCGESSSVLRLGLGFSVRF